MDPKDLATRCQSCGMPLHTGIPMDETFLGTEADGSPNKTYCKFCYVAGAFVDPAMTMKDMIEKQAGHMTRVLKIPTDKAKETAMELIPKLARWAKVEP